MKAWELLSEEGKWTQGRYARDEDGEGCPSSNGDAFCFCAIGAINRCCPNPDDWTAAIGKVQTALKTLGLGPCIADWNDAPERTQGEVVALLKELDV